MSAFAIKLDFRSGASRPREKAHMLTPRQRLLKRTLDLSLAIPVLIATAPLTLFAALASTVDTHQCGIFAQTRVGRNARPFRIYKVRTMRPFDGTSTTATAAGDARITRLGSVLRRWKVDELPQLVNVVRGEMSLVGPRPDVPGFADLLEGRDRAILKLRPGITGPAQLQFRDEEKLLAGVHDPERYSSDVLWPAKVSSNLAYIENYSLRLDLYYICTTLLRDSKRADGPKKRRSVGFWSRRIGRPERSNSARVKMVRF